MGYDEKGDTVRKSEGEGGGGWGSYQIAFFLPAK